MPLCGVSHFTQQLSDHRVTVRSNAYLLPLLHERHDRLGAGVCLPRARWTLDGKNASLEREHRIHEVLHGILTRRGGKWSCREHRRKRKEERARSPIAHARSHLEAAVISRTLAEREQ